MAAAVDETESVPAISGEGENAVVADATAKNAVSVVAAAADSAPVDGVFVSWAPKTPRRRTKTKRQLKQMLGVGALLQAYKEEQNKPPPTPEVVNGQSDVESVSKKHKKVKKPKKPKKPREELSDGEMSSSSSSSSSSESSDDDEMSGRAWRRQKQRAAAKSSSVDLKKVFRDVYENRHSFVQQCQFQQKMKLLWSLRMAISGQYDAVMQKKELVADYLCK